jgi:hypothetical protein
MRRLILCLIAPLVATCFVGSAGAAGPTLDVAGIKIGMSEDDAIEALKAHNPRLPLSQPGHRIEGISEPVRPFVTGHVLPTGDLDGETVTLLFTMPPGLKILWGIQRTTNYPAPRRPSTEATVAALRDKYGPDNVPLNLAMSGNLAWVFDANGSLMAPGAAKQAYMLCMTRMQLHFGSDDMESFNDIQTGLRGPAADATKIVLITANVQSTQPNPSSPSVVVNLNVTMNDGLIYGPAIEATRAQVMQAVNARQSKENSDVNKRAAPSL